MLIDTHCHIHSSDYSDGEGAYERSILSSVSKLICVGTDIKDSAKAVQFAAKHDNAWAAVGVHPHESKHGVDGLKELLSSKKVVAIGEIGLDYYYEHSDRATQRHVLEQQVQMALDNNLPIIFHIRDAYEDFWPIFNGFQGIKGVIHSFTGTQSELETALSNNLLIGVNGISTFTKDESQRQVYRNIPLDKVLLETDSPYLTPAPYRGKVNEPAYVYEVVRHMSTDRLIPIEMLAEQTTRNATNLFTI